MFHRTTIVLVVCAGLVWGGAVPAIAFCDVVFKDVAATADFVLLVEYDAPRRQDPRVLVVEVLKGGSDRKMLRLGPHGLSALDPAEGDLFLVALTDRHTLVKLVPGMGVCSPISVLPLRGGKLRKKDRGDYDGASRAMTLDELRQDLAPRSASGL